MKRRPRESDRDAAKRIVLHRRASFIAAAIASSSMATACACLKVKPDAEPTDASTSSVTTPPPDEGAPPMDAGAITPRPCLKPPNRNEGR